MAKKKKQVELTAPRWRESIYAEATKAERDVTGQVATLVSSRAVAALQYELDAANEELRIYRDQDASLRADIKQRNERIEAAEANAAESVKTLHEVGDRLRKEYANERERAKAWQTTAGELRIENTRLKESQNGLKALLADGCESRRLMAGERDEACQALFCWRLATVLLASLSGTLAAILFLAR